MGQTKKKSKTNKVGHNEYIYSINETRIMGRKEYYVAINMIWFLTKNTTWCIKIYYNLTPLFTKITQLIYPDQGTMCGFLNCVSSPLCSYISCINI